MRERFFEAGHKNTKQLIQRDLEYSGIDNPDKWRDALDLKIPLELEVEGKDQNFDKLLSFIEGGTEQVSDYEKIEAFKETEDSIKKLEILRTLSIRDVITCLRDYSYNPAQFKYLSKRLDFYRKLFQGKIIRNFSS